MTTTPTRIGLVGGGVAAISAAESLREQGFGGEIVLVSEEAQAPYDRPPLSKDVILGLTPEDGTTLLTEERAASLDIQLVLGERVTGLDARAGRLTLASGRELPVDRVLLATGGRARELPVPGADLPQVRTLRTVADAVAVRGMLQEGGGPVVVVGGGFIGLEVAAAARAKGCDVTVVESAGGVLSRVLPDAPAQHVAAHHGAAGIRLETGTSVVGVAGTGSVEAVLLGDGRRLDAACVVVGVGMVPSVELAEQAGAEVDNGVVTDGHLRTANDAVFAAGDVVRAPDPWRDGELVRVEQWQTARTHGIVAAHAMLGLEPPAHPVPWSWSDQGDLRLQVAGVPQAGQRVVVRGEDGDLARTWFHLHDDGRLAGAITTQRIPDVRAALTLIEGGHVVDPEVLADPGADLRRLARQLAKGG